MICLGNMRKGGVAPGQEAYNIALKACAGAGEWDRASALLEDMSASGATSPDPNVINEIQAGRDAAAAAAAAAAAPEARAGEGGVGVAGGGMRGGGGDGTVRNVSRGLSYISSRYSSCNNTGGGGSAVVARTGCLGPFDAVGLGSSRGSSTSSTSNNNNNVSRSNGGTCSRSSSNNGGVGFSTVSTSGLDCGGSYRFDDERVGGFIADGRVSTSSAFQTGSVEKYGGRGVGGRGRDLGCLAAEGGGGFEAPGDDLFWGDGGGGDEHEVSWGND